MSLLIVVGETYICNGTYAIGVPYNVRHTTAAALLRPQIEAMIAVQELYRYVLYTLVYR